MEVANGLVIYSDISSKILNDRNDSVKWNLSTRLQNISSSMQHVAKTEQIVSREK